MVFPEIGENLARRARARIATSCAMCWFISGAVDCCAGVAEDWTCFEDALAAADFWSLHRDDFRRGGLDGARWTILGRRNGLSHVVHHWSPCGPVYNLGRRFVELTGLDAIRGHFRKKFWRRRMVEVIRTPADQGCSEDRVASGEMIHR